MRSPGRSGRYQSHEPPDTNTCTPRNIPLVCFLISSGIGSPSMGVLTWPIIVPCPIWVPQRVAGPYSSSVYSGLSSPTPSAQLRIASGVATE